MVTIKYNKDSNLSTTIIYTSSNLEVRVTSFRRHHPTCILAALWSYHLSSCVEWCCLIHSKILVTPLWMAHIQNYSMVTEVRVTVQQLWRYSSPGGDTHIKKVTWVCLPTQNQNQLYFHIIIKHNIYRQQKFRERTNCNVIWRSNQKARRVRTRLPLDYTSYQRAISDNFLAKRFTRWW